MPNVSGSKQRRSGHVHAAVHVQGLPGDVTRTRRTQEEHCGSDVIDRAQTRHRDLGCESAALLVAERAGHVGVLSLIHISEPTRLLSISYAVFCLKKKK